MPDVALFGQEWHGPDEVAIFSATSDDYRVQLAQLLPPGRAWTRRTESALQTLLGALGDTFYRAEQRAYQLFAEAIPSTTDEMIDEWEAFAGLPGACDTNPPTLLADRQAVLVARLTSQQPPRAVYILALAAAMGYPDAELTRYHDPFLCTSPCNHAVQEQGGFWTNAYLLIAHGTGANDSALRCAVLDAWPEHGQIFFDFTTP